MTLDDLTLTQAEKLNLRNIMEYCYRDGSPTLHQRADITERDLKTRLVTYVCGECENKIYRPMVTLTEKGGAK